LKLRLASQPSEIADYRTLVRLALLMMHYVYLLRSESHPNQQYIGSTQNLKQRILSHNRDSSPHTSKFFPWLLVAYCGFAKEKTAIAFERYLKSGSGRAFANRHFLK
jgi:putative endonuclease